MTDEQFAVVYKAARNAKWPQIEGVKPSAWWRGLLVLTFNTGLRRGTLFDLKTADVDWQKGVLNVPAEITKTDMGQRLPLNATVMRHLLELRTDGDLLLNHPGSQSYFTRRFHELQSAAGLDRSEHFGLHSIRRTLGTRLYAHDPSAAQLALGHSTIDTTERFYVNSSQIIERAMNSLPQPAIFTRRTKRKQLVG